jgi:predicted nucleotidyltransferase
MQIDGKATSNKDELFTLLRQHEKDSAAFGLKKMGIFGSFVKNDVK